LLSESRRRMWDVGLWLAPARPPQGAALQSNWDTAETLKQSATGNTEAPRHREMPLPFQISVPLYLGGEKVLSEFSRSSLARGPAQTCALATRWRGGFRGSWRRACHASRCSVFRGLVRGLVGKGRLTTRGRQHNPSWLAETRRTATGRPPPVRPRDSVCPSAYPRKAVAGRNCLRGRDGLSAKEFRRILIKPAPRALVWRQGPTRHKDQSRYNRQYLESDPRDARRRA
jgi:hypothetical protein